MSIPATIAGPEGYGVLPCDRHSCTIDEFTEAFAVGRTDEEDRMEILADWAAFRDMQHSVGLSPLSYWVNGGFTTDKVGTSDVDVLTIFDGNVVPPDFAAATPWIDPGPRWKSEPVPIFGSHASSRCVCRRQG